MNASHHHWPVRIIILMAMIGILQSCQSVGGIPGASQSVTVSAPDIERLRARLSEFHTALGANDILHRYKMTSPSIRDTMSFEQFKKDVRWEENAPRRKNEKMDASLVRVCSCEQMHYLRCVLVVDVAITGAGNKISRDQPLEMWEYVSGDWYLGIIGASSRGRCPGEH